MLWLLNKFSLSVPKEMYEKKSMESMDNDVRVQQVKIIRFSLNQWTKTR